MVHLALPSCSRGRHMVACALRAAGAHSWHTRGTPLTRMLAPALPRSPPHLSAGTAGVWRCCLPPWPMREASARRKTRHQCTGRRSTPVIHLPHDNQGRRHRVLGPGIRQPSASLPVPLPAHQPRLPPHDRWLLSRSWVACTMTTGLRKKRHDAMHDTCYGSQEGRRVAPAIREESAQ